MRHHAFVRPAMQASLLLACALPAHLSWAQVVPSQSQTPPGEELARPSLDADIDLTIGGAMAAPAGAEGVNIIIDAVSIDGGFDPVAPDTLALLPKPGSKVTLAEIYASAGAIQQTYLEAGYPLVRVFVPVQDLDPKHAQVSLKVVSGFIGKVDTDALDPRVRRVIARFLEPLIGREHLRASALERAVLLAGDVSGVQLSTALSPGRQTGETVLIVNGRFHPVQAILSVDNRLSPELGREQATFSAALNSTLGLGERLGVTVASAIENPSLGKAALRRFGGAYLDIPVGNDGLVLGADASLSTARPRGLAAFLSLSSRYQHFGGRVSFPLVRDRTRRLTASTSIDFNQETQDSLLLGFPVPLFHDQTRVSRMGLNGSVQASRSLFISADIEYSRGLDILNARRANEASIFEPLSRIDADAVFDKLAGGMFVEFGLPKTPVSGRLIIRGQTGFGDPLLRSEQFSFAAPNLVSGPPTGSLVGDTAVAARSQIDVLAVSKGVHFAPYAFAAAAHSRLESPTSLERALTDAYSAGVGVNLDISLGAFVATGTLEFSHTGSNDANARGEWVTFQFALRF